MKDNCACQGYETYVLVVVILQLNFISSFYVCHSRCWSYRTVSTVL